MTFPRIAWTVDGKPRDIRDWMCTAELGGFLAMVGKVEASAARAIVQGQEVRGWVGLDVIWEGRISEKPIVERGEAEVKAVGYRVESEKSNDRLLYQSRDYGMWAVDDDDPHNYVANEAEVDAEVRPGSLFVKVENGIAIAVDHDHGFAFWAPGAVGGITRYACSVTDVACGANEVLRSKRATGPSGALTTIASHAYAVNGTVAVDQAVTGSSDLLLLEYRRTATPVTLAVPKTVRISNLRVNGIAPADTFYTSEVVADIGARLGWDTAQVQATTLNALPLDLVDSSWADGMDLMAMLDDWAWFLGPGKVLEYHPWTDTVWTTTLARGANASLRPIEMFNRVVVNYDTVAGKPAEVAVDADPDPLPGVTNVFEEELDDVQPNSTLAEAVAATLLAHVSSQRYEGTVSLAEVKNSAGGGNPFMVRPGHQLRIADFGPAESVTLRVHNVEYREDSVSVGIEYPVSAAALIARDALTDARRPWRRGKKKRKKRRRR